MPVYDYLCERCGPFTLMRPMAEAALDAACPACARGSARAILTAPRLAGLSPERRQAHAVNERSAHAPRSSKGSHGPGCGCCGAKPSSKPSGASSGHANGAKTFPTKRPWMISH